MAEALSTIVLCELLNTFSVRLSVINNIGIFKGHMFRLISAADSADNGKKNQRRLMAFAIRWVCINIYVHKADWSSPKKWTKQIE